MERSTRYLAIGFAVGVIVARRTGRRRKRGRKAQGGLARIVGTGGGWTRVALEAATLGVALREIAHELEAAPARRVIGSPPARRVLEPGRAKDENDRTAIAGGGTEGWSEGR